MSQIVNWEYYSSLFDKKVKEEDFVKAEAKAEREVCTVIGPIRWDEITEETYGYNKLKECICNVINKQADYDASGVGKGISSASNDGYSESYVIQTEEQRQNELHNLIMDWLSGTGMVGAY